MLHTYFFTVETFNGTLNVNLIGVNSVLRKVDLIGSVGVINLVVKMPANKLHLTNGKSIDVFCKGLLKR